jgi:hypothetical protein
MRAMSEPNPTPIRRLVSGTGGVLRIVALLVGVLVIAIYGLGDRSVDPTAPPSTPPAAIVGAATASAPEPSTALPTPTPTPTVEPPDALLLLLTLRPLLRVRLVSRPLLAR